MILSHHHRFVFIKGVKVAGTSAEIALSQVCGPEDIVTPITPADERFRMGTTGEPRNYMARYVPKWLRRTLEGRYVDAIQTSSTEQLGSLRAPWPAFRNHMPLTEVLKRVPNAGSYEIVCVERSPYAKVMSLANWSRQAQAYNRGETLTNSLGTLGEGVDGIIANGNIRRVLNIDRYRDFGGTIRVSPWRVETLSEDLSRFFADRGISPVRLVYAKRGAQSDNVAARAVLRPDQIRTINEIFAEEFEAFDWPILNP